MGCQISFCFSFWTTVFLLWSRGNFPWKSRLIGVANIVMLSRDTYVVGKFGNIAKLDHAL